MSNVNQNDTQKPSFKEIIKGKNAKRIVLVFFILFSALCFYTAFQNGVDEANSKKTSVESESGRMKTTIDDNF